MAGTLFLVVGPSGSGKDTLLAGTRAQLIGNLGFVFPSRVITRPADAGGEVHEEASPADFDKRRDAGDFMLHWEAHGLQYGIPERHACDLELGRHVVVNVSRGIIDEVASRYPRMVVFEVTAPPEVLGQRLPVRSRESRDDIGRRLVRNPGPIPDNVERRIIDNSSTVEDGVAQMTDALLSEIGRSVSQPLRRKIAGFALGHDEYRDVIADIVSGKFDEQDIADFLVAVTKTLTRDETTALARARADSRPAWSGMRNWSQTSTRWAAPRATESR